MISSAFCCRRQPAELGLPAFVSSRISFTAKYKSTTLTHGDHGGWHKGQATGNAGYSNSSLQILANVVGVEVRVGDTGPTYSPLAFNVFPPAASIQFNYTSDYQSGRPGAAGDLGVAANAPGDLGTYPYGYSTGSPYFQLRERRH